MMDWWENSWETPLESLIDFFPTIKCSRSNVDEENWSGIMCWHFLCRFISNAIESKMGNELWHKIDMFVCVKYTERWIVEMNGRIRKKNIEMNRKRRQNMGQSNGKEDDHKNKKITRLPKEMGRK